MQLTWCVDYSFILVKTKKAVPAGLIARNLSSSKSTMVCTEDNVQQPQLTILMKVFAFQFFPLYRMLNLICLVSVTS